MELIRFSTPVRGFHPVSDFIEGYFDVLTDQVAQYVAGQQNKGVKAALLGPKPQSSMVETAVKVFSCFTIVIPVIIFIAKVVFRSIHTFYAFVPPEQRQTPDYLSFTFENDTIYLNKCKFDGNVENAMAYLEKFCTENSVRMESRGYGYGSFIVNETRHSITPHGIDLHMVLKFCGNKSSKDFPYCDFN